MSRFTPEEDAILRKQLMRKGAGINRQLTQVLAGKNITLSGVKLPHHETPGMTPAEKLRLFLDLVIAAQRRLGTDEFGTCLTCGVGFSYAGLIDTPWRDICTECEIKFRDPYAV
jgi:hypothetical protein